MTNDLTLSEVSADTINSNFAKVKDAVNSKAELIGDSTQTFNVAIASKETEAINKGQFDDCLEHLSPNTKFCMNSGNLTNGVADLFLYSGPTIFTKTGDYPEAIGKNVKGTQLAISKKLTIDMSGYSNGTYNIFLTESGELEAFSSNLYKQAKTPSNPITNDIWLDISQEPLSAKKYDCSSWVEYTGIPLGKATVENNLVSAIETNPYNENGYNVNSQTEGLYAFDNSAGVGKILPYTAEKDGFMRIVTGTATEPNQFEYYTLDGVGVNEPVCPATGYWLTISVQMAKGQTLALGTCTTGSSSTRTYTFYPRKGNN